LEGGVTEGAKTALHWAALALLSLALVTGLELLRLPAALLLGSLAAAALFAAIDVRLRVHLRLFQGAQAVVGGMIAQAFPVATVSEIGRDWPVFLGGVLSVIAVSGGLGWLLARWRVLPGSTAVWGSSPGAATAMTLISESYGADMLLVAFMQYTRVVLVAVVATIIARLWLGRRPAPRRTSIGFRRWRGPLSR
jgi:membrane AbrB-like protein